MGLYFTLPLYFLTSMKTRVITTKIGIQINMVCIIKLSKFLPYWSLLVIERGFYIFVSCIFVNIVWLNYDFWKFWLLVYHKSSLGSHIQSICILGKKINGTILVMELKLVAFYNIKWILSKQIFWYNWAPRSKGSMLDVF